MCDVCLKAWFWGPQVVSGKVLRESCFHFKKWWSISRCITAITYDYTYPSRSSEAFDVVLDKLGMFLGMRYWQSGNDREGQFVPSESADVGRTP